MTARPLGGVGRRDSDDIRADACDGQSRRTHGLTSAVKCARERRSHSVIFDRAVRRERFPEARPLHLHCGHEHDTAPPRTRTQASRLGRLTASFRTTAPTLPRSTDATSGPAVESARVWPSLQRRPFHFNDGMRLRGVIDGACWSDGVSETTRGRVVTCRCRLEWHKQELTAHPLCSAGRLWCEACRDAGDAGARLACHP